MSTTESNETTQFMKNLNALRKAAAEIDTMAEPDIDKLIPLVESGTNAYKACSERISEVEKILGIVPKEAE
jgi:exodeoxyribonuclease VII small subunit